MDARAQDHQLVPGSGPRLESALRLAESRLQLLSSFYSGEDQSVASQIRSMREPWRSQSLVAKGKIGQSLVIPLYTKQVKLVRRWK